MKLHTLRHLTLTGLLALAACNGGGDDGMDPMDGEDTDMTDDGEDTDDTDDTDVEDTDDTDTDDTLYAQLGGEAGVDAVLDAFLANVLANDEINWFFADTDAANLKAQLHDQICEAAGGGCTYTGADMVTAHAGMAITDAQFHSMVGDLVAALDTLGVDYTAGSFDGGLPADQLITVLAGMQSDIVEDPDGDQVYFNELGGRASVEAVIDELLAVVAADARINGFFATTDLEALDAQLVDQVCEATSGFCTYTGADMVTAHAGLCIAQDDWDAFVEDLFTALDNLAVPYSTGLDGTALADDLVITLAGFASDLVEDPDNDGCD